MLRDFVVAHRAGILSECLHNLEQMYPGRAREELMDGFAEFIDDIVSTLRAAEGAGGDGNAPRQPSVDAARHGARRLGSGFDLSGVIHDYGLVCDTIAEAAVRADIVVRPRELLGLCHCVEKSVTAAMESYVAAMREREEEYRAEQLGFLAHEIRNALGSAATGFELIRSASVAPHGRTADVIQRAFARITALVGQMLADSLLLGGVVAQKERLRR